RDERCENSTGNRMLDAVKCTDNLLADFIDFIREEPNSKDTIILILPDHLMMSFFSNSALSIEENSRKLYAILLNSGLKQRESNSIIYSDIAPLVLKRLGIEHNAVFLLENHDNRTMEERLEHLSKNLEKIRSFNNKTLLRD
ncbi:MAG: hypothetical protein LBI29_01875, partial [Rickettsiales bacterium]|nr:hypothetical protein [Rickettsiales bacterium]